MIPPYSAVIDYETTGFNAIRNDGITLGVVILDHNLLPIDETYLKFKPDLYKGVNEENVATHVHGISLKEMMFFPERRESLIKLMQFLIPYKNKDNKPIPLFYHASTRFDYFFMEWAFRKENLEYSMWKVFDIKNQYRTIKIAEDLGYVKNDLDTWAVRIDETFEHHNALADAEICAKVILYILKNNFQGNVQSFFEFIAKGRDGKQQEEVQEVSKDERPWSLLDI